MATTNDFVICTVSSESLPSCTDHSGLEGWVGRRAEIAMVNQTSRRKRNAPATKWYIKRFCVTAKLVRV